MIYFLYLCSNSLVIKTDNNYTRIGISLVVN